MLRANVRSLDIAELAATQGGSNIARLLFDTLTALDDRGIVQPGLASSWQSDPGHRRWQFALRPGVTFADGSPLTADGVAASLRANNPGWHVAALDGGVTLDLDSTDVDVPAELALVRNSIVKRDATSAQGSGPFVIKDWQPGKKIVLAARDEYWEGRPFLDSLEIDLGGDSRALDYGKYDVAESTPERARRSGGSQVSAGSELLALLFIRPPVSNEENRLRAGLSLSIDRKAIADVVLQGAAEPARGLLPGWLTGYDFLFSLEANLSLARQTVGEIRQRTPWSLGYDAADPVERLLAERIALNANDVGIKLLPTSAANADMQLIRLRLPSLDPHVALRSWATKAGLIPPSFARNSSEELYGAERALLQTQQIIPLAHLKTAVVLAGSVNGWSNSRSGEWRLADVWLRADKP